LEKEMDIDVRSIGVSENVKSMNVKKGLIIHDKNDRVIPIEQAINVQRNWANSELLEIEGTGHFRILRTDFVLKKAIEFLED
ncbi:MAG: hypothetical protein AAF639_22825, partial [Chloroflexota bacterium]